MLNPTPAGRLNRISEEALCIGCGLCQAVAGSDKVQVLKTPDGALRPISSDMLDHAAVDAVYRTCPGTRLEGLPTDLIDAKTQIDPVWGAYHRMVKAHAGDPEVRFKGATGGVLTALAVHLLESGQVDFILHATASKTDPSFGVRHVSRTRSDVLAGAGSRYGPTATLIDIDRWLDEGRPFAFVGTPCDVSALRNLAREDSRVDALCRIMMAMVCGGFMQTPALATKTAGFGLDFDRLTSVRYRGYGCPGPTRLQQDDGQIVEKSYLDFWGEDESTWSLPWRCKVCADGIGDAADIAASDVWPGGAPTPEQAADHTLDPGANAVMARTACAAALIDSAVVAGDLVVEKEIGPADMTVWQPHQVRKKQAVWSRYQGMAAAGHMAPRTARLRLEELHDENPPGVNDAQIAGAEERVRLGKASEPTPQAEDNPVVRGGAMLRP